VFPFFLEHPVYSTAYMNQTSNRKRFLQSWKQQLIGMT